MAHRNPAVVQQFLPCDRKSKKKKKNVLKRVQALRDHKQCGCDMLKWENYK